MAQNITIAEALLDFGGGGLPIDILVPPGGGGGNGGGGNQTSAQVSWRMQGGSYIPGNGFSGLNLNGPPQNPNSLLNFSFLEINDNAFYNMSRFNFDLSSGEFIDGSNVSLDNEHEPNGPIAHDPNNFTFGPNSSTGTGFGIGYEITNTGLNMSMRNYRAAFLRIDGRSEIDIDEINHNTIGVMLPAEDIPSLSDPFRVGELAAGAFWPASVSVGAGDNGSDPIGVGLGKDIHVGGKGNAFSDKI